MEMQKHRLGERCLLLFGNCKNSCKEGSVPAFWPATIQWAMKGWEASRCLDETSIVETDGVEMFILNWLVRVLNI